MVLWSPVAARALVAVCWLVLVFHPSAVPMVAYAQYAIFFVRVSCVAWCFVFGGFMSGLVAFSGSRSLSPIFAGLVAAVVGSVVRSGRGVSVGCCVGADTLVLSALSPLAALAPVPLRGTGFYQCFAAFASCGAGSCSLSAVPAVAGFAAAGGSVSWLSGGSLSVPLHARLTARSAAVVGAASVACVVFFASPSSRGSLLACRLALARGLPVFAFACGFCGSALPSLGAGSWVAVGGVGVWSSAFKFISHQNNIFE